MAEGFHDMIAKISRPSFVMDEARLFLDTHPDNCEALALFKENACARERAIADFTDVYGPLCSYDNFSSGEWKWVDTPWPWEGR